MKHSLIVIPTKNEMANIALVIKSVLKYMPQSTIVRKFTKDSRVKLIVRKGKKGRGGAVLEGFKWGLSRKMITSGYIVLSEFIYIAYLQGKKIGKIPIVFVNRVRGANLTLKEVFCAIYGVIKLRIKRKELIKKQ